MTTTPKPDKNMERLLKGAYDKVITEWSRPAFEKLGSRLQSALLAEQLVILVNAQDDMVSAEVSKRIITEGWSWVIEVTDR